jgi:hypothetical protein
MTYENRVAKYVITETTENSTGTYSCQARNDAGSAETSCQLKIQGIYIYIYITNFKSNRFYFPFICIDFLTHSTDILLFNKV